jgi:prophage regulatory protein
VTDDYSILRLPEVLKARGRSKPSHYEDIQNGLFTHPVLLGGRSVGWPETEVRTINLARIAGRTEEEIRALVTQLEAMRKAAS